MDPQLLTQSNGGLSNKASTAKFHEPDDCSPPSDIHCIINGVLIGYTRVHAGEAEQRGHRGSFHRLISKKLTLLTLIHLKPFKVIMLFSLLSQFNHFLQHVFNYVLFSEASLCCDLWKETFCCFGLLQFHMLKG